MEAFQISSGAYNMIVCLKKEYNEGLLLNNCVDSYTKELIDSTLKKCPEWTPLKYKSPGKWFIGTIETSLKDKIIRCALDSYTITVSSYLPARAKNLYDSISTVAKVGFAELINDDKYHSTFSILKCDEYVLFNTLTVMSNYKERLPKTFVKDKYGLMKLVEKVCLLEDVLGVYHRDLSSNNIMVDKKGNVKLIDFDSADVDVSYKSYNQRCCYFFAHINELCGKRVEPADVMPWSLASLILYYYKKPDLAVSSDDRYKLIDIGEKKGYDKYMQIYWYVMGVYEKEFKGFKRLSLRSCYDMMPEPLLDFVERLLKGNCKVSDEACKLADGLGVKGWKEKYSKMCVGLFDKVIPRVNEFLDLSMHPLEKEWFVHACSKNVKVIEYLVTLFICRQVSISSFSEYLNVSYIVHNAIDVDLDVYESHLTETTTLESLHYIVNMLHSVLPAVTTLNRFAFMNFNGGMEGKRMGFADYHYGNTVFIMVFLYGLKSAERGQCFVERCKKDKLLIGQVLDYWDDKLPFSIRSLKR